MKTLDRILQNWRIAKVRPYMSNGIRVLDVGCADGVLFRHFKTEIREAIGIDPTLSESIEMDHCKLIAGHFPQNLPDAEPFDAVTMLAVVEHIPKKELHRWAAACAQLLKPGGHLLITTPSAAVDRILDVLKFLRLIDGMSLEEHYGFEPSDVPSLFSVGGMKLIHAKKFQLGLNNFFVFKKSTI